MALSRLSQFSKTLQSQSRRLWNFRSYASGPNKIINPAAPLSQPFPGLPDVEYAKPSTNTPEIRITTLDNGLRVASIERFGQFCTVGVVIDSGPRYEVSFPSGISHFLEKLAFHSTQDYQSKDQILVDVERHGGICDSQCSRDTVIYATSADRRGIETVTRVLGETVLRPRFNDAEIEFARQAVQFELESLNLRPEQDTVLMERIHGAAYRGNTLGLPKLCPPENIDKIDRDVLMSFLRLHHTPSRMVVAGVGVDHDELVKYTEKYFTQKSTWDQEGIKSTTVNAVDTSVAQYTGGEVTEQCVIPVYAASGLPELVHGVIGLESPSHQDPDFIPTCVLNLMMGGGGSFSAGGPGKGMYTRLYTNVMNQFNWVSSATATNHSYADSGLFSIHISALPEHIAKAMRVIAREMVSMAAMPGTGELRRAKTQLQSMLLMNLEARPVVFEDIGRQVLVTGGRKNPEHYMQKIEQVTAEDIVRVARRLLSSPPSIAARGNIKELPPLAEIQQTLSNTDVNSSSQFRMPFMSFLR